MSELDQLTNIITTILGKDNQARQQSELYLAQLQIKDLDQYVIVFANLLNVSPRKDIRTFCALHLRRVLSDFADDIAESQWPNLTAETQKILKEILIQTLLKETEPSPRKILCELIGELVATIKTMDDETKKECPEEGRQWDSIMEHIWTLLTSGDITLMGSGLKILGILFKHCHMDFVDHTEQLIQILKQALEHQDIKIKTRAIEALAEFLNIADYKDCKPYADLMPFVLADILLIIDKDEDLGVEVMAYLTDVVEIEGKIFKHHFMQTIDTLKAIAQNEEVSTSALRENALETIILLVEKFPKLSGKQEGLVKGIYQAIFSYMITCAIEADDEWMKPREGYLQTKEENESHEFSIKYCMDLFNRIIPCLGQEQTLPPFSAMLTDMVGTNDWRFKYSALMALSQVGEHITSIAEMDPIVDFTLRFFKDENPKVRYAAFHCAGQLSDDKRFDFQQRFSPTVIPALIDAFNDQVPRVLAHALAALTNFLEGSNKAAVEGYTTSILEPCLNFIDTGISLVKENAISTIAALAEAAKEDFIPYWQKTAEIIFNVLKNVHQREYKQLRGQAIECLTLMGEAIGKEEFSKAADEIIKVMISIQQNHVEEVDPQKAYLLAGWQRLSSIFKNDFVQYLNELLPSLFIMIEKTIDAYEKKQNAVTGDDEVYDVENALGENKAEKNFLYSANTSESEEVVVAIKMISTFLTESSEGCLPYIVRTSKIFAHLLQRTRNDNIKLTVSKALAGAIRVLKAAPNKEMEVATTSNAYLNMLWKLYSDEREIGNLITFLSSMKLIIQAAGRSMDERQIKAINDNIVSALTESDRRKISNQEELLEEINDVDEDQIHRLQEENEKEEELHCVIADLIGALFETHQELMLPFAQSIVKMIIPNSLSPQASPKIQKFGLILVCHMVEHLGALIPNDVQILSDIIIRFAGSPLPEVRDAATNGIGMLAEKGKEGFQAIAEKCYKGLLISLSIKPKKEEDQRVYWRARVRTVISLGKLIKQQSQHINVKEAVQIWIRQLPMAYYTEDAKQQHEMLIDIIELDPKLAFGENGQELPHVVKIFAQLTNSKLISNTFMPKMKKVIEALAANQETKPVLQEAIAKLSPDLQGRLQKALE